MLFTPIKPMLASWGDEPFDDGAYGFEPKWDGHRLLLHKEGERAALYTRSGQEVGGLFPELRELAAAIRARSAILDGEGVVLRGGVPVFDDMSYRLRIRQEPKIRAAVRTHPLAFIAFDLLSAEGRERMREPLGERKQRLAEAVPATPHMMPSLYQEGHGRALFELTRTRGLEGIVAKRRDSLYRPGAVSPDWVKIKHAREIDTIVLGYREKPFELLLGLNFRTVPNKPVGTVSPVLGDAERRQFIAAAQPLRKPHTDASGLQQLVPSLCCRIRYRDRTDMHRLLRTEFVAFLPGKRPEDCIWG